MDEDLLWSVGREREIAVSRRASSRFLVGLETRGCSAGEGVSWVEVMAEGSILPMKVHRFLFGTALGGSLASFGELVFVVSTLFKLDSEECLLYAVGWVVPGVTCADVVLTIPSKPRNGLAAVD